MYGSVLQRICLASNSTFPPLDFCAPEGMGLAFTLEERQALGIHGLLPPCFKTQDSQMKLIKLNLDRYTDPLNKFVYLMSLQERNEKLFYRFLSENVEEVMPIVYTPTVGLACQNYGLLYRQPKGMYITIHDRGHVLNVLRNWPEHDVRAVCVTDGERILGLGDLGAYGMGIPVGKLALYTALAGIKPHYCLPVTIDVGTNNEKLLEDPLYIGLKQKRTKGTDYDALIDEFMDACSKRYGHNILIQFEDFANQNAFRLLEKYKHKYCTFNDDIQGTASVAVAGLFASLRVTKTRMSDHIIVFFGAGEASLGIAELCVHAMSKEGTSDADARAKIWMVDSKGLIVFNRAEGGLNEHKIKFAKNEGSIPKLIDVVKKVKPSILIGAAAVPGAFTEEILREMSKNHKTPVVFALSNPTSKAECTAEQAYTFTDGSCLFASGSPFPPFSINGKTHYPGQGNNAYIFPGIGLGVICAEIRHITDEQFLIAAQALADQVLDADLNRGSLYPPLSKIRQVSVGIALKIVEEAYKTGKTSFTKEPENMYEYIVSHMYDYSYEPVGAHQYAWPTSATNPS